LQVIAIAPCAESAPFTPQLVLVFSVTYRLAAYEAAELGVSLSPLLLGEVVQKPPLLDELHHRSFYESNSIAFSALLSMTSSV
jgi:hypothetical protein